MNIELTMPELIMLVRALGYPQENIYGNYQHTADALRGKLIDAQETGGYTEGQQNPICAPPTHGTIEDAVENLYALRVFKDGLEYRVWDTFRREDGSVSGYCCHYVNGEGGGRVVLDADKVEVYKLVRVR